MADVSTTEIEVRKQPYVEGEVKASGAVVPVERIGSIGDARRIYDGLKVYRDQRGADYAKIRGQRDGNRPYSQKKLAELGQGWRANINYGQHEALIDQNIDKFWMLGNSVDNVVTAACHYDDPQFPDGEIAQHAEELYTRIWREWEDRIFLEQLMLDQMLEFGHTALRFSDAHNWQFDVVRSGLVVYARNAEARPNKLKFAMEFGTVYASALLRLFRDADGKLTDEEMQAAAKDEGWNLDVAKAVMRMHFNDPGVNRDEAEKSTFEYIQQMFKNNDISMDEAYFKDINCAWLWVQEYDGTASLYTFATDITGAKDSDMDGFLFRKRSIAPSMVSAFIPLLYSFGDGTMRSVRGVGQRIFPHVELADRSMNMAFDAGTFNASMIVSKRGPGAETKGAIVRMGPVTVLDADYQPMQQQYKPNFEALLGLRDIVGRLMASKAPFFQASGNPSAREKSATEVKTDAMEEASISSAKVALHYGQLDLVHREVWRRLTAKDYPSHAPGYKQHKLFMDEWKRLGLPEEALVPGKITVSATRVTGGGSTSEKMRINERITGLVPMFDDDGRHAALRNEVVGLVGTENANRFIKARPTELTTTSETSLAVLENYAMESGRIIPVSSGQPVIIHMHTHMGPLVAMYQKYQQDPRTVNPAQAVPYLASVIPHMQAHVNVIRKDKTRKGLVKQYDAQIEQLGAFTDKLEKVHQSQQDDQQKAQQEQARLQQAQQQQVTQQQLDIADLKHKMTMREMSTQSNIAAKSQKTAATIQDAHLLAQAEALKKSGGNGGVPVT